MLYQLSYFRIFRSRGPAVEPDFVGEDGFEPPKV